MLIRATSVTKERDATTGLSTGWSVESMYILIQIDAIFSPIEHSPSIDPNETLVCLDVDRRPSYVRMW